MVKGGSMLNTCPVSNLGELKLRIPCDRPSQEAEITCHQTYRCLSQVLGLPPGRPATTAVPLPNITLFANGQNTPFASCLVIWQACQGMTQRPYQVWQTAGEFRVWEYQGSSGRLRYRLPQALGDGGWDMRVIVMHLLLAACVTQRDRPWEEDVVINDQLIAEFLGWHQRKDLNRLQKLLLLEAWMRQASALEVEVFWQQRGPIPAVHLPFAPLWLVRPTYHVATAKDGSTYLSGLSFQVRAGPWATYFLQRHQARPKTAYYQYGWLPRSLPAKIMQLWKRYPGSVVLLLHLLFQSRVRQEPLTKVATLLKLIYGDQAVQQAWHQAELRRKLITTWELDLYPLFDYGFRPLFREDCYPRAIQPDWFTAQELPDDPEEAFHYWVNRPPEAKMNSKQKWLQLFNAAICLEEFPADWPMNFRPKWKKTPAKPRSRPAVGHPITGALVRQARLQQHLSQRQLAALLHKSQSWLRDIEAGRYSLKPKDVALLQTVLPNLAGTPAG